MQIEVEHNLYFNNPCSMSNAGLLMAAVASNAATAPSILNLRTLNPYVATAVADWRKIAAPVPLLSRQMGPNNGSTVTSIAGASSFGMSGVNAHILLGSKSHMVLAEEPHQPWKRSRSASLHKLKPRM